MRILVFFALATIGSCTAESLKELSALSVHGRSVPGFSDYGGAVTLEGRQLWLEVRDPDGVIGTELLILFDPGRRTFWWQLESAVHDG